MISAQIRLHYGFEVHSNRTAEMSREGGTKSESRGYSGDQFSSTIGERKEKGCGQKHTRETNELLVGRGQRTEGSEYNKVCLCVCEELETRV